MDVADTTPTSNERARRIFYLITVGLGCVAGAVPAFIDTDFPWFGDFYATLVPLVLLAMLALWIGYAARRIARPLFEWGLWAVIVGYNACVLILAIYLGPDAYAGLFLDAFTLFSSTVYLWSFLAFGRRLGAIASGAFLVLTSGLGAPYLLGLVAQRSDHEAIVTMLVTFPGVAAVMVTGLYAISHFLEASVRARVLAEATAELAFYDALTGLPNRRLFDDRLTQAIRVAERGGAAFALAFLGIDDFKVVNDTLGHGTGDLLLRRFAERLRGALRDSDTVARISGDEFALILPTIGSRDAVDVVGEKLQRTLEAPFDLGGLDHRVSVSIGFALYPEQGASSQTLLEHADRAMYIVKGEGKGAHRLHASADPVAERAITDPGAQVAS